MIEAADHAFMARALSLARRGDASTDPNPTVGCVIVQGDTVVGEGFTQPPGGNHAEIEALAAAGGDAGGGTVYVSLEPCAHTGRTGPCTEALIAAGVNRVVYAVGDPHPDVSGRGEQRLREAGIEVAGPLLAAEAEAVNRGFFSRHRRGRPWIRCKMAASLDGRTALANGKSQWITGESARRDVHGWRARSSAVMTGIGTVLADDPTLTARPESFELPLVQPVRVVCDSGLRTPPSARMLAAEGETVVFATAAALESADGRRQVLESAGATIEVAGAAARLDLGAVTTRLAELEINTVWLEAGPTLAGAMLDAGLVDELVLYLAPSILGSTARGLFDLPILERLDDRLGLTIDDVRSVGDDLRIMATPAKT